MTKKTCNGWTYEPELGGGVTGWVRQRQDGSDIYLSPPESTDGKHWTLWFADETTVSMEATSVLMATAWANDLLKHSGHEEEGAR